MAVIVGPSGIGKSVALQTVLDEISIRSTGGLPTCLKIKAKPDSSPRQLVEDVAIGLGEKPPLGLNTNRFRLADLSAEDIIINDLKLLAIDDAEELDARCYNFLRYLFARTGCAILVVGLHPIMRVIRKHEKFENRINLQLDFPTLSEDEVLQTFLPQLSLPHWVFDPTSEHDQLLGKRLWASVNPSLRSLREVLQNASQFADEERQERITLDLVTQGYHMTPQRRHPGGLEEEQEQEIVPEEHTAFEEVSELRQKDKRQRQEQR